VKYKHVSPLQQLTRKDKSRHCKTCVDQKVDAGTPLQCSNCKLWKAEAALQTNNKQHKNCIHTRVCMSCKERRRCKGPCEASKTEAEFTAGAWEHALKPSSTQGRCTDCMRLGNWTCKRCKKKKPKPELCMWTEAHPNSKQDTTTKCNTCMLLLQDQQRQEEEKRKSNMAHVVVSSAGQGQNQMGINQVMYNCTCPGCQAVARSSQHTGKIMVNHVDVHGKRCTRQFRVANGQVSVPHSFCYEHSTCILKGPDNYGVSRTEFPQRVKFKQCNKDFRTNGASVKWCSTSVHGCRKVDAILA